MRCPCAKGSGAGPTAKKIDASEVLEGYRCEGSGRFQRKELQMLEGSKREDVMLGVLEQGAKGSGER